jgi:hypothetical protein
MYFLDIALALVNEHQLRRYIGHPGSDCFCLWVACGQPTLSLQAPQRQAFTIAERDWGIGH